jgi:hypothetical protein
MNDLELLMKAGHKAYSRFATSRIMIDVEAKVALARLKLQGLEAQDDRARARKSVEKAAKQNP